MLSTLAQELYELGKKAIAGDEDSLVDFIDLYRQEYINNLDYAKLTEDEDSILFDIYITIEICELNAKTRDELYDEESYTRYEALEEIKERKIIEELEELDKVQVVE